MTRDYTAGAGMTTLELAEYTHGYVLTHRLNSASVAPKPDNSLHQLRVDKEGVGEDGGSEKMGCFGSGDGWDQPG